MQGQSCNRHVEFSKLGVKWDVGTQKSFLPKYDVNLMLTLCCLKKINQFSLLYHFSLKLIWNLVKLNKTCPPLPPSLSVTLAVY